MNRIMNATNSKLRALLKSRLMKWLEFRNLVTKVDNFFNDHKLCELMKRKYSREVNDLDHKLDFYSILLELLYEVDRSDPHEQPRLFRQVLEWHRTNHVKLKLMSGKALQGNVVAQLSECTNNGQVYQERDEVDKKGTENHHKNSLGEVKSLQTSDRIWTDENVVYPSIATLKPKVPMLRKKPTIPENATRPKTSPEPRTLTKQYKPALQQRTERFATFIERSFSPQESSQEKCSQTSEKKGVLNLREVLSAANAISTQIELTKMKRAQSVSPYQSQGALRVPEKSPQQKALPHSTKGVKVIQDWRGCISQCSSTALSVVVMEPTPLRAWSAKKVSKARRRVPERQSNVQKALNSIVLQKDAIGQRETTVEGNPEKKMWENAPLESPECQRLQRTDPEKGGVLPHDTGQQEINRLHVEKGHKIQISANSPGSTIAQVQGANVLRKQEYSDRTGKYKTGSEMDGRPPRGFKKTEITSVKIPDTSKADRGQVTYFPSSFDSQSLISPKGVRDNKHKVNKRCKVRAPSNVLARSTMTTINKEKQNYIMEKIYNTKCTSAIQKGENLFLFTRDDCTHFQLLKNYKVFDEYIPETSYNEAYLTYTSETGQYPATTDQDQHMHASLVELIDSRECNKSILDYEQTMQSIQMRVLGHCLQLQDSSKVKKYPHLAHDLVKRPALSTYSKKMQSFQIIKPTKADRPIAMYFQPKGTVRTNILSIIIRSEVDF
ncbi:uncharacterized protein [Scyliorhinus torazame]|uniref:uncharacterized protein n=1 Tax=Scyliorhinus torazame TaxID=75743 RepID=UPI003B5A3A85